VAHILTTGRVQGTSRCRQTYIYTLSHSSSAYITASNCILIMMCFETASALRSQNILLSLHYVRKWSNAVWQGLLSPSPAVCFPQSLTTWSKTCLVFLSSRLSWKYRGRVYIYRMWMVLWAMGLRQSGSIHTFVALYQVFFIHLVLSGNQNQMWKRCTCWW